MIKEKVQFSLPKHPFLTESQDPHNVLVELFSSYTIEDIRIIMWEKLKAELASGNYKSTKEVNDAIFFNETILIGLEAVYMVYDKVPKKKSRPSKR